MLFICIHICATASLDYAELIWNSRKAQYGVIIVLVAYYIVYSNQRNMKIKGATCTAVLRCVEYCFCYHGNYMNTLAMFQ